MLVRLPDVARTTRDVDCALVSATQQTAIAELEQAAHAVPDDRDFLDFELVKSKPGHVEDLVSLSFRVRFGDRVHGTVKLDVHVVRDHRTLGELVPLRRRVDPPKQGGWPDRIPVMTVADHVAEKLVALYSVHNGRPSSRERDIVDLALLARYAPPAPGALEPALGRALERPTVPSVSVELPELFVAPVRFRPAFERMDHGPSWATSMAEIAAMSAPALQQHARSDARRPDRDAPRPGGDE